MVNLRGGVLSAILQSTVVCTLGRICGYHGVKSKHSQSRLTL